MTEGMTIAVVGAGSIGLYYGGKLAHGGHDVRFLMRSGIDEARSEGIHILTEAGDIHVRQPSVATTSNEIGPVDLVIVALKSTSNGAIPHLLPPLLKADTMILTLQNGLGNEEYLAGLFGAQRVLGGLCFICLTRQSPATVRKIGKGKVSIGEFERSLQPRTHALGEAFQTSGINISLVENLAQERWRKLVWNVPFNGLSVARGGITVDQILADPALHAECRALMEETISVAGALGHPIEHSYADFQIQRTYPMGAYEPSTLIDWRAGAALEIEPIWGEPLRAARRVGVAVPHLEALYAELNRISG